ncbi:hypothetical protein AQUCO_02700213v1 [Aquilegia coerulea]|uniref:Uncharacterized protein n=1 Tax=Aquilegia coerulea TaxID=218851 RepID=A0A2G5D5U1_AQUCA|nr:hypothetical protein AQUCO_02700213v1 [Aquilegia coerulea]
MKSQWQKHTLGPNPIKVLICHAFKVNILLQTPFNSINKNPYHKLPVIASTVGAVFCLYLSSIAFCKIK